MGHRDEQGLTAASVGVTSAAAMLRRLCRARVRYLLLAGLVTAGLALLLLHSLNSGHQPNPTPVGEDEVQPPPEVNKVADKPHKTGAMWPEVKVARNRVDQCSPLPPAKDVDISTPDVYPTLNVKPPYRNYWNYTFERRYLQRRDHWPQLPLKVIVVPHSHNDPGWLKTFDGYFIAYTAYILNNMVEKLTRHKDLTMVWAEISYFSKWWNSLKNRPHLRDQVKELVYNGQLELVTGGWVMTDEAAAHYYAMIDQLIEGHQWMKTTLGVAPYNGWSIDPFGHSSTVPYLLRSAGLANMVVQRTHYAWKQYLAERQQLDFWWQQFFDGPSANRSGGHDILCHMAPFDLYSIKHTCGPDTDVCLQFDFRRVSGEYTESRATQITAENIEERADLLLGQYGRLASLFPHNVALVPLGDDFRYNHDVEWDQQYQNYHRLFEYINSRHDWFAEVKFGTLTTFFSEVHQRMKHIQDDFPTLAGDFLPYVDIYGEKRPSHWTGYFTTRPYWKQLSRDLEHWLRSTEILYSLVRSRVQQQQGSTRLRHRLEQDYAYLAQARDSLAIFQHHDAITGTSKEAVMRDYGMRLYRGIRDCKGIIAHAALYVMSEEEIRRPADLYPAQRVLSYLYPDVERASFDSLPKKVSLSVPFVEGRKIVVFNSLAQQTQEPIRVKVKTPHVRVLDSSDRDVPVQINPSWNGTVEVMSDVYELLFLAVLPPLSLTSFLILPLEDAAGSPRSVVSVMVNDALTSPPRDSVFMFLNPTDEDIEISSSLISATFSKTTGLLQTLSLKEGAAANRVQTVFQAYRSEDFRSGAYLFQASGTEPVKNVSGRFPIIRVVRGPLVSEVTVLYPGVVSMTSRIYQTTGPLGGGLEIETVADLGQMADTNLELFLRFQTDIRSGNVFYTDANGFQMVRRQSHTHLPLEANYYPVTSAAYVEDDRSRLTLLTSHAHGATSTQSGWLEVMLDRRLQNDDNRGLGEGVLDNKKTKAMFWLLLEERNPAKDELPNISLLGNLLTSSLNYPPVVLATNGKTQRPLKQSITFLSGAFPCGVHLVNLRTLPVVDDFQAPSNSSLLLLHRKGRSCHVKDTVSTLCDASPEGGSLGSLRVHVSSIHRTTLTGLSPLYKVARLADVRVRPMEIHAYNVTFAR